MLVFEKEAHLYSPEAEPLSMTFVNTVSWRSGPLHEERLKTYTDLVAWGVRNEIISEAESRSLLDQAALKPETAQRVHEEAVAFRDALYRIFSKAAADSTPEPADLNLLNEKVAAAFKHLTLKWQTSGFAWAWLAPQDSLDRMLWPVARSATDLLTSEEVMRVGECAADNCGWIFLDTSKNHSRRWCDMNACGNRTKARKFYKRKKASQAEENELSKEARTTPEA